MKGYKAFEKGLKCKGFQYEVGKEYIHSGGIKICEEGFHFCQNPLDTLNYYNLCESEFTEVEATGETNGHNEDSKVVTSKIKIGIKLDLPVFIKAAFDFLWQTCTDKENPASGDGSQLAASGNGSQLAASGYGSQLAASGYGSQLAASGYCSKLAASGYGSQLAASGNGSQLAASGDGSQLAASGDGSKLELNGKDSVGAAIGFRSQIKGKKGNWIVLAEYGPNYKPICVKATQIDGKNIKEDVYYKLCNGEFVLAE